MVHIIGDVFYFRRVSQCVFLSAFLLGFFVFSFQAHAATFTVATTTDTTDASAGNGTCADSNGECSLRAAIQEANALAGADTITFSITPLGGGSVATITPATVLPEITGQVTIDGTTQSGTSCGDLWGGTAPVWKVVLQGSGSDSLHYGLKLTAGTSTIKGLHITGFSSASTMGETPSDGNDGANRAIGLWLATIGNNTIECNYITGNGREILIQSSHSNTIGGTSAGKGNVLNNSGTHGVLFIDSNTTTLAGNFIGTTVAGSAAAANGNDGVSVRGTSANTTIGGTSAGARNLISGNSGTGIYTGSNTSGTIIRGNYIGTNAAGTGALGNSSGIDNNGTGTIVGGTATGAGNVLSGNSSGGTSSGINLSGSGGATVQGNYIGTNAAGTASLPNTMGILILSGSNVIGGDDASERNIIAGNTYGIYGAGTGNSIQGNYIGTGANGTTALGNGYGIMLVGGANNNTIGGTAAGTGNIIANSTNEGVILLDIPGFLGSDAGTGNAILGNTIYTNGNRGIKLTSSTPASTIDTNDADTGPNNLQNYPVITTATTDGSTTSVTGTLNSLASATYRIEFFGSATADASGNGEGTVYLGSTSVTTSSNNASFTVTGLTGTTVGYVITATASQDLGSSNYSTSEFSLAFISTAPATPAAEITTTTTTVVSNGSPFVFSGSGNPFAAGTINIILPTFVSNTPTLSPEASSSSHSSPTPASPPSIESLRTQLAQLQQQLQILLSQSPQIPPILTIRFPRDLRYGDKGDDVYQLQLFLINAKSGNQALYLKQNGATHFYGLLTTRAVAEFQRKEDITPANGSFGPKTRAVVEGR